MLIYAVMEKDTVVEEGRNLKAAIKKQEMNLEEEMWGNNMIV